MHGEMSINQREPVFGSPSSSALHRLCRRTSTSAVSVIRLLDRATADHFATICQSAFPGFSSFPILECEGRDYSGKGLLEAFSQPNLHTGNVISILSRKARGEVLSFIQRTRFTWK